VAGPEFSTNETFIYRGNDLTFDDRRVNEAYVMMLIPRLGCWLMNRAVDPRYAQTLH
jgi:hypothetical protein